MRERVPQFRTVEVSHAMKMEGNLKEAGAYKEYEKWHRLQNLKWVAFGFVVVAGLLTIWPVEVWLSGNAGLDQAFAAFYAFWWKVFTGEVNALVALYRTYGLLLRNTFTGTGLPPVSLMVWIGLLIAVPVGFKAFNRYRQTPNIFGDARWANEDDIEEMASRDLIGFEDARKATNRKSLFILGKFKNRLLRMGETLSVLLLAPPGTGKSVGFIVPSIVELDHASIFVHDQKPELWDMTAGHRSKLGPAYLLKWAAQDQPNGQVVTEAQAMAMDPSVLVCDKSGKPQKNDQTGLYRTIPLYYPSWNPLSFKTMPPIGVSRDMYLDRLSETLCPDGATGDKFWTSKARAALTGLTHYLTGKIEAAQDEKIKWNWNNIPEQWRNREPSYPMLVDFFAYGQSGAGGEDPLRDFLKILVDEAILLDKEYERVRGIRPMNRAIVELTSLMGTNPTTRGSIITTFDDAMGPFKMESVRQRTSASDFAFYELRGVPTKEAREREDKRVAEAAAKGDVYRAQYGKDEWKPVSIYISVDLENARAFSRITSVFIDAANAYLVTNGPGAVDEQGNQLGPYPFVFLIDEAPQLGKLDTVINGPAVGRSKKISYIIVGQDFGQFEQKYSRPEVETLKSTTAIKIVLTQNNENTAKQISEMAGKMTFQKQSLSDKPRKGIEGFLRGPGKSASESWEGVEFLRPSFLTSMPRDKHVVLVQNFMNRPIYCDTPKFFLETKNRKGKGSIAEKVLNLRTFVGPKPGVPMSADLMAIAAKRRVVFEEQKKKAQDAAESGVPPVSVPVAAPQAGGLQTGGQPSVAQVQEADDGRRVVVLTPTDIAAMARDVDGQDDNRGAVFPFVLYATSLAPGADELDPPADGDLVITHDIKEVAEVIGSSKFWVYSQEQLGTEIDRALAQIGEKPIGSRCVILKEVAESLGEKSTSDIWHLGFQGGPALEFPGLGSDPEKIFCVNWACQIISFLIATDMRNQLYTDDAFVEAMADDVDEQVSFDASEDGGEGEDGPVEVADIAI